MTGESKITEEQATKLNAQEHLSGPDSLLGTVVSDRYQILRLIGLGGMGTVYQAKHLNMNKLLALKVLSLNQATTELSRKRFQRECKASANLLHQNLVPVHDYGYLDTGQPYIVMDYVDGESLADLLKQGPLPESRALPIFCQIADALSEAHRMGVVHRDLKPSNVMIERGDKVRVVDFGIAKVSEGQDEKNLTTTGEIFGSPAYMSPEQCRGAASVDARSDIYSLGCVMCETLTGMAPHSGANALETIFKHTNELPKPFAAVTPTNSVSSGVEAIVRQCLEKIPESRYQSSDDLKAALQNPVSQANKARLPSALKVLLNAALLSVLLLACLYAFRPIEVHHHDDTAPATTSASQLATTDSQKSDTTGSATALPAADLILQSAETLSHTDPVNAINNLKHYMDEFEAINHTRHRFDYARVELDYGSRMRNAGLCHEADPYAKEAYETMKSLRGPKSEYTEWALFNYACCKSLEKDPAAQALFEQDLALRAELNGKDSLAYGEAVRYYADFFTQQGDYRKAKELAEQAIAIEKAVPNHDQKQIATMEEYLQRLNRKLQAQP